MKPTSVVIMDLDDTLWDWVGIWHASFTAMLDRLEQSFEGTTVGDDGREKSNFSLSAARQ